MSEASSEQGPDGRKPELVLRLDGFAQDALVEESAQMGVPVRDLAAFAILYYLADLDSDRIARFIPRGLPQTEV